MLPLTHHTWIMSPHYLVKCTTFSSDFTQWRYVAFLQTLVSLKKPVVGWHWYSFEKTGCDVWQMECQASNVTANVQSDHFLHGYMLPVFFATDQLHHPPCSAKIQPISQQDASATRPYRGLVYSIRVKKWKKTKNLRILQGNVMTFLGVVGKGVTVCFLLRYRK